MHFCVQPSLEACFAEKQPRFPTKIQCEIIGLVRTCSTETPNNAMLSKLTIRTVKNVLGQTVGMVLIIQSHKFFTFSGLRSRSPHVRSGAFSRQVLACTKKFLDLFLPLTTQHHQQTSSNMCYTNNKIMALKRSMDDANNNDEEGQRYRKRQRQSQNPRTVQFAVDRTAIIEFEKLDAETKADVWYSVSLVFAFIMIQAQFHPLRTIILTFFFSLQ